MADVANLQIKVTGDINDLKKSMSDAKLSVNQFASSADTSLKSIGFEFTGLAKSGTNSLLVLKEKLSQLKGALFTEGDIAKVRVFNAEIKNIEGGIKGLETAGNSSLGAIGSGATKAFSAVRQLAYILPGIGVAGILGFATGAISDFVKYLYDANKAIDTLKASQQDLAEISQQANKNVGGEAIDLRILYNASQDLTLSLTERNKAVKQLQDLYPETFKNFTAEQIELGKAKIAYDDLTKSIIKKALASAAEGKLAELSTQELNLFVSNQEKLASLRKKLGDASLRQNDAAIYSKGYIELIKKQGEEYTKELQSIKDREQKIIDFVGTENLVDAVIGKPDKAKKAIETIADVLKKLKETLGTIDTESVFDKLFGLNTSTQPEKKIQAIFETIKKLATKFHLAPEDTIIQKLLGQAQDIRLTEIVRRIQIGFDQEIKGTKLIIPPEAFDVGAAEETGFAAANDYTEGLKAGLILRLNKLHIKFNPFDNPEGLQKALDDAQGRIAAFAAEATKTLQQFAVTTATAIGDAIGQGLANAGKSGGNVFSSLFSSIFKALGAGLRQLGIYAITTSKLILALKANIGTTLGIAGGIALVALGTLISASASKLNNVPGFAGGVKNFRGGVALVGERGPELVNLPAGSDVIPNHALGAIGRQETQVYIPEYRINGIDLITVFKRADQQYGRNT